ncbi:MAG: hypothetical protein LKE40_10945 [Spirochaetia bacterium]|nr:hypothetical protein [Spirochaetia bacterium]
MKHIKNWVLPMIFESEWRCKCQEDFQSIVDDIKRRLGDLPKMQGKNHTKGACVLRSHGTFSRYIVRTKVGIFRIDKAKIAFKIAMGYKQLSETAKMFRDIKDVLEIHPVYHMIDDRIKFHILICWMTMVLVRYAEEKIVLTYFSISQTLRGITAKLIKTKSSTL